MRTGEFGIFGSMDAEDFLARDAGRTLRKEAGSVGTNQKPGALDASGLWTKK